MNWTMLSSINKSKFDLDKILGTRDVIQKPIFRIDRAKRVNKAQKHEQNKHFAPLAMSLANT